MKCERVLLNLEGVISQITLNSPPANRMNLFVFISFREKLNEVEADPAVRVIILTGQGNKGLCNGYL